MPPGRKNKRGAHGSAEEEILAAKRSNMANRCLAGASKEDNLSQASDQVEQEEPSLHEIKSMLVDIQITVSSIALKNKQLQKELADLKKSVQTKDKYFCELKSRSTKQPSPKMLWKRNYKRQLPHLKRHEEISINN